MKRGVLGIASVIVLAAGCGSDPSSFEGSDEALTEARTSRVEYRSDSKGAVFIDWVATGVVDYANHRGEILMKNKDEPSGMRALYVGRDVYLGASLGGKMVWIKETPNYEEDGAARFLPGPDGVSPDQLIDALVKASKNVEKLGKTLVRGVTTTHYRAHLDETKVGLESDRSQPHELVVEVWVDDDALVRRIRVPFGAEGDLASIVDLYDFGVPVDVKTPAAEDIVSEKRFNELAEESCRGAAPEASAERVPDFVCLMFGASGSSGSGVEDLSPTETMPRTVTDSR